MLTPEEYWAGRRGEWRAKWKALSLEEQRTARTAAELARIAAAAHVAEVASGYGLTRWARVWVFRWLAVPLHLSLMIIALMNRRFAVLFGLPLLAFMIWSIVHDERRLRAGRAANLTAWQLAQATRS